MRRSPQMSIAASSTRPTRWPVLALIETIGAKSRNGTSLRIHSTYSSKVRVGLVLDEVPLVDRDDQALALLDHVARDVRVLRGQALDGVEDEHRDVRPRERLERAQRRVLLRGRARRRPCRGAGSRPCR